MARYDYEDYEPYIIIERRDSSSSSVGSLLLGAALGAGLALLFAPQSGEDTRRDIEDQAKRARARAGQLADDLSASVSDTLDHARSQVEESIDAARGAVDMRRQQVTRAVEAGRAAAHQARSELERRIAEGKAAYEAGVTAARDQAASSREADDIAEAVSSAPMGAVPGATVNTPAAG